MQTSLRARFQQMGSAVLPRSPYLVFLFLLKRDNQGNRRLFRYVRGMPNWSAGCSFLAKREQGGKYLYGVLFRRDNYEVAAKFGDPSVEENWLDSDTSTDGSFVGL